MKSETTVRAGRGARAIAPIERTSMTLRERAADVIRQAIIDHRLPPGTHLKERELCEMLGVSRTSVREALRHLETEQLISTVPHRGPVVVSLTADDARQLYQVRAVLEGRPGAHRDVVVLNAAAGWPPSACPATPPGP